jgi:hypothetical protein
MKDRAHIESRLKLLRASIERDSPDSTIEFEAFPEIENHIGFGIAVNGALTLVWVDLTVDPWWLMVDGCIAPGLDNLDVPLNWVNTRNADALFGKYFCRINQEQGRAAIFYEFNLPGSMIENAAHYALNRGEQFLLNYVTSGIWTVANASAREGDELLAAHGGVRFEATTEHLTFLSMMLTG